MRPPSSYFHPRANSALGRIRRGRRSRRWLDIGARAPGNHRTPVPVLFSDHAVKYVIASALCLGGGVNDELGLIAELLDPAGNIGGRVVDRAVRDTSNSAQIGGCHLRNDFFDGV